MSTRKYLLGSDFFFFLKRKNWKTNWISKGYSNKFVIGNKQNIAENLDEKDIKIKNIISN